MALFGFISALDSADFLMIFLLFFLKESVNVVAGMVTPKAFDHVVLSFCLPGKVVRGSV